MKSSKTVPVEKVEILMQEFLNVIEGSINTIDQIAELNTYKVNGLKVINSSKFRMHLRKLKVQLLKDLANPEYLPEEPPEPPSAS